MRQHIRAAIVDDEDPARANLGALLGEVPDIDVIGQCRSIQELEAFLETHYVDVVFLDISMRGTTGLQWCRQQRGRTLPRVVFVTAHSPPAVEAFDLDVLDYVLKPIRLDRLSRAVERVRDAITQERMVPKGERIPIRYGSREVLVPVDSIVWIRANGNYVEVHQDDRWHLLRESFEGLLERLGKDFVRTHRSVAVRSAAVREIRAQDDGHVAITQGGAELPISRRRIGLVRQLVRRG